MTLGRGVQFILKPLADYAPLFSRKMSEHPGDWINDERKPTTSSSTTKSLSLELSEELDTVISQVTHSSSTVRRPVNLL